MRIVLVNWAKIWEGATSGGGVNQYSQALAIELVKRGHDVISLFGGTTYVTEPTRGPFVRRHDDWLGVKVFEVINSPVLAPSIAQFARPLEEASSPELERLVATLMERLSPDAVHWNNIEGFSAGCVSAARRGAPRARQVYSLHNYHTICPQVYLMQGHRRTCMSFDNGHACTNCIAVKDPAERRASIESQWQADYDRAVEGERVAWHSAMANIKRVFVGPVRISAAKKRAKGVLPGHPTPLGGDSGLAGPPPTSPLPVQGADPRGTSAHLMAELHPWKPPPPDAPELRPLRNDIRPEPPSDKPLNEYGRRRAAMVEMLSGCDAVLGVSDFVVRKFVSMGVPPDRIRTLAIGSRINRVVKLKPDLLFDPPAHPPRDMGRSEQWRSMRPLRLHFMGYNNYYKGLHVLAEALEMLDLDHLNRVDLSVFALDGHTIEWMFRRMEPRLARLTFSGAYTYHDIPWMLGGKDLTVVPSVWWDNAPQTVFESLACGVPVLGADIGGIPDFVTHAHNGLLFEANNRRSLADRLVQAIEDPWLVQGLRANVRPGKSIEEHVVEMEAIYAGR